MRQLFRTEINPQPQKVDALDATAALNNYWTCDSGNEVDGPYETLARALDTGPLGSATELIYCSEYSAVELAAILRCVADWTWSAHRNP